MPLVLDKYGNKFGKSEGNALWLDINKTSSYELYQYLINVDDSMVIDYLKIFTFLSKEEIEELEKTNQEKPELREAHKALAREIITDLHGSAEYEKALRMSEVLFTGNVKSLTKDELEIVLKNMPHYEINQELNVVDLLVNTGICQSKREAREFINSGSIIINEEKITDETKIIGKDMAIDNEILVVRRGKKKYFIIKMK